MASVDSRPQGVASPAAKFPTKLRRHYARSRSGCLTCRQRKKKCDERKPTCAGCCRNKLQCTWPAGVSVEAGTKEAARNSSPDSSGTPNSTSINVDTSNWGAGVLAGMPDGPTTPDASPPIVGSGCPRWQDVIQTFYRGSGKRSTMLPESPIKYLDFAQPPEDGDGAASPGGSFGLILAADSAETVVSWSDALRAFVSPSRALLLSPTSGALLRHYIAETGPVTSTAPRGPHSPCMVAILPVAYQDDLVMHAVLALAGAHLGGRSACSTSKGSLKWNCGDPYYPREPSDADTNPSSDASTHAAALAALQRATTSHYACVLRGLRGALRDLDHGDLGKVLRILLVLILVSLYESVSSSCLNGCAFSHLRAARQLVLYLLDDGAGDSGMNSNKDRGSPGGSTRTVTVQQLRVDERYLLAMLVEAYSYYVLINNVCAYGSIEWRAIPHDDFVLDPELVASRLDLGLGEGDPFGAMFAGCHRLFAMIGEVSQLAALCLREEKEREKANSRQHGGQQCQSESHSMRSLLSAEAQALYDSFHARITSWEPSSPTAAGPNAACYFGVLAQHTADSTCEHHDKTAHAAISETLRHALFIFLEMAIWGSRPPTTELKLALQTHVVTLGKSIIDNQVVTSRFSSILLWPITIAGSVLAHDDERALIRQGLRLAPVASWATVRASQVLEMLWEEQRAGNVLAYGPYGLYLIMKKHRIYMSLS